MSPISRRIFLTASAGVAAGGARAEVAAVENRLPDALDGSSPRFWPEDLGFVVVDFHGARGDCPKTGPTAGATDDSDAIEAALSACPDGGIVRFSPGRCYMVSRPIRATGKQVNIDARGATIRCRDDSVWHVFTLGGEGRDGMVEEVSIWGGTWDGNRGHQRYWPNTDGTTIFTERGSERWGAHQGSPFYENSPVNGTLWRSGWLDGEAGDDIDVNGGGNDGLIRIQFTRRAAYHCCTARDWVRNGFVTWSCHDTLFLDPHGSGQLPTHFHELNALFAQPAEAAFLKANGGNEENAALRGGFPHSVKVVGGKCLGGVMPIFCRTNQPKPEAAANRAVIDGFEAYGFSRDMWFEEVSEVRIAKCQIVGLYAPASSRGAAGIFLSNGTTDWSITDTYIRGHVDTRQKQDNRQGSLTNVVLECEAELDDWVVRCETISGTVIRSRGRGAACVDAVNVDVQADADASLMIEGSAVNCRVGADRFEGRRVLLDLEEGQQTIDLGASDLGGLTLLRRMNPNVQGGKWYEIHQSAYEIRGGRIRFENTAVAGDRIEATWHDLLRDRFLGDGARTRFQLTKPGASRAGDVLSVTVNGVEIPAGALVREEEAPQFLVLAPRRGLREIELLNLRLPPGTSVEVVYRPPLTPFAGLKLGGRGGQPVRADLVCRNIRGVCCEGAVDLSGRFEDLAGRAALSLDDGGELSLHDAVIRRSRGGIIAGSNVNAAPARLRIVDCLFEDWALDGDALVEEEARAFGGNARSGLTVTDWAILQGNVWMRSGREAGASGDPGRLRAFLPLASVSGNVYAGTSGELRYDAEVEASP